MAKKPILSDVTNLLTMAATLNANSDLIETAFENTLSRDGSTPNAMGADLDINNFDLLNVKRIDATDFYVSGSPISATIQESQTAAAASATDAATSASEASTSAAEAALYEGTWIDDVASLIADTSLTYTVGQPGTVAPGDYVRTRKEGFSYKVSASGATDQHLTTAGGVKLTVIPAYVGSSGGIGNIRALGAGNGNAAQDVAAFDTAIAVANTLGATGSSGMETAAVTWRVPTGAYDLSAGLTEYIKKDNIWFVGDSPDGTKIIGSAGTIFRWGAEADPTVPNGGGLRDMTFIYPAAPVASALCIDLPNAVRQRFSGIRMRNVNKFVALGSATKQAIAIGFSDISGWVYNSGLPTYDLVNGAGFYLEQSVMFVQGVPVPSTYGAHIAVDGTDFIRCQGKWDTILVNSVTCNRYDRSLNFLNTLNNVINNIKISQFYGDYSKRGAIFGAPVGATGANNTTLISLSQCWFVAINGDGLTFTVNSLGGISNVTLNEVQTTLCSGDGIKFVCPATAIKYVDVTDCSNLGAAGGGAGSGLLLDGVADITVKGGRYGLSQVGVLAAQAVDGVKITAASRRYNVSGVHATGSASDYNIVDPAAGPAGCLVAGNHNISGARPSYATNPASAVVPASGVDYTNTSPFRMAAYGYAGTVTTFRHNSVAVAGAGNSTIILEPGDAWSSVYTAAPQLLVAKKP